jgi:hypothetical protein
VLENLDAPQFGSMDMEFEQAGEFTEECQFMLLLINLPADSQLQQINMIMSIIQWTLLTIMLL